MHCWMNIQRYKFFSYVLLKVVLVSAIKLCERKMCICFHKFLKRCVGFVLSNCLNAKKKKYFWHIKYTIQHSIERSQTSKYIQYNIHDTKLYELLIYFNYIRAEKLRPCVRCSVASNFFLNFFFLETKTFLLQKKNLFSSEV